MTRPKGQVANLLQEYSVPLLCGAVLALLFANADPDAYHAILQWELVSGFRIFGHLVTFEFLVNDVFMVFFFATAAKEITEASLPGGSLNPLSKAVSPLVATAGGVLGPVGFFLLGLWFCVDQGILATDVHSIETMARGWGIPTATDIALAWLVARTVFGRRHPAVVFLLLLAVADDAIGLVIIAIFYGDPTLPAEPIWLMVSLFGVGIAFMLRLARVRTWQAYVLLAGPFAWSGLMLAHLHPALALAIIVPFMPGPSRDTGLFEDDDKTASERSPLEAFEHQMKGFVDFGLFFFAFANAGVELSDVGPLTTIVLVALILGKTLGVGLFGLLALKLGFPLPAGMSKRDLWMAGFIAALGLTVALFMASAAYVDPVLQGQAKMGALLSGTVGLLAILVGRMLGIRPQQSSDETATGEVP